MRKYIHIDKRSRELLQKAFGIISRAVFNALHYEHESDGSELMRIVRATALARGGVVMIEAPADAALIDGGGYMRQTLPGGVLIEFRYADNSCTVYYRGEARERYDDVSLC